MILFEISLDLLGFTVLIIARTHLKCENARKVMSTNEILKY